MSSSQTRQTLCKPLQRSAQTQSMVQNESGRETEPKSVQARKTIHESECDCSYLSVGRSPTQASQTQQLTRSYKAQPFHKLQVAEGWPHPLIVVGKAWKSDEKHERPGKIAKASHLITLLPGCAPFQAIFMLPRNVFPSIASPSTWISLMTGIPLPATMPRAESQRHFFLLIQAWRFLATSIDCLAVNFDDSDCRS